MVRLNALGQSAIEIGEVRICPEQPYLFAIALYLIVERGKKIPRQALVELIWPNVKDEKHARQRFRQNLLRLRELGLPVAGENGTLLLDKHAAQADFDALTSPDGINPGEGLEFLPHYAPKISERFLDWVDTHRSRVHARVQRVFLLRMQQARSRGDWAEVESLAGECLKLDPYNEEAVMAQAECAVMRGSKREALGILDSYMEALGSHVGTIGLPAKILRTRIAERLTDQRYAMISEQHFVGRESSMELLLNLLREAQRGSGSAAFIWGEPGIGKSRLVQEVTQLATLEGAQVVATKCHPTDAGRPLSAFADLVPVLKTLPGALGCSAETLSLLQRLTDRNKKETYPAQEAGDAAFLAAAIRRALFDLVDAVADEGLLIVVIEDVHWLDDPSWTVLRAMVEWSTTRTLLLLMTSRTGHATEAKVVEPDRGLHRHHLLPLVDSDSAALLDKLAAYDSHPLTQSVRTWSIGAAEGNPFYLRELLRHWVETQQIFGVPRSLAELIEARLNRLSSLSLRVLQLCAAFGKHSGFERLEKATGYANHVLLDAIEELSTAAMLASDKPAVSVKHDLLAAAALGRLGGAALKLVHRQVAVVLETEIKANHTASLMWDCAEHWQGAGETSHALATVQLCAKHLHSVGQVDQAIELFDRAVRICATPEEKLETLVGLVGSLKAAGQWTRLKAVIGDLQGLALTQRSPILIDDLRLLDMETRWRLRRQSDAIVRELSDFARDRQKHAAQRLQAIRLGIIACSDEGRAEDAISMFKLVAELEASANRPDLVAHIRMIFHADFGDVQEAQAPAEELLAYQIEVGEPGAVARARGNVACYYRRAGLILESRRLYCENFEFASDHHLHSDAMRSAILLALLALQEEDVACAEQWVARAIRHQAGMDELVLSDSLMSIKARIALQRGNADAAREYLRQYNSPAEYDASFRYRLTVQAIRHQLQLTEKGPIDRANLESMARDFEQHCRFGQCDFFAVILYRALVAAGDSSRAGILLQSYLTSWRRDRGPLPPSLAAEADKLRAPAPSA